MGDEKTNEYEDFPRRRRSDDLTLNEWRLNVVEKDISELQTAMKNVATKSDLNELRSKIDAIPSNFRNWFVGITTVILLAIGTLAAFVHH